MIDERSHNAPRESSIDEIVVQNFRRKLKTLLHEILTVASRALSPTLKSQQFYTSFEFLDTRILTELFNGTFAKR